MTAAPFLAFVLPLLAAPDGALVEGIAFNRATGTRVPGVTVKLSPVTAASHVLYTTKSDGAGVFRIEGVRAGDYLPSFVVPDGFVPPALWEPPCQPLHIGENSRGVKLVIPLRPLLTLPVRVVDREGRPVPNVRVECFRATGGGGATGMTNSEGRSFLAGLLAGAYKLRARPVLAGTPLGQRLKNLSTLPSRPPEGESWVWTPTYFPDATELAGAETLIVSEGVDPPEYEIRLRSAPAHRLRGVVSDPAGQAVPGASVSLLSEIGWGTDEASVASAADGSFEFASVRAGEWQVVARAKRGETALKGFAQVVMPQRDLEGIPVQVSPPFVVHAAFEGLPPDRMRPTTSLVPTTGPNEQEADASSRPDGTNRFEEVYAGRYRVAQWGALSGYYLKSIMLGAEDITGKAADFTPQSPLLKLIYVSKPARVWGAIEFGTGVKVVLVDTAQEEYIPGQDVRVAMCDDQGRFAIDDLRPGTYHAFAFAIEGVSSEAVRRAVFGLGLSREAQTVRLGEGEAARLDLKITPFPVALQRP